MVQTLGRRYDRQTFTIEPLASPLRGELWYLLYGKAIGDPASAIHLDVVACDGRTFQVKWQRDGLARGTVKVVSGSTVILTYTGKRAPSGRFAFASPGEEGESEFREVLRVTPSGLKLKSRRVLPVQP